MRYTSADIRGIVAILPTPALDGADRWDASDTVDLAETERMTDALVESGVDVILTNGTFGAGASLTLPEVLAFNDASVTTVAGRVPVFAGATTLNTRDTIDRSRRLVDLGADGLFLGRPMWVALDARQIVDFHTAVAEALPGRSQILYDNPSAFKGKISSETYAALSHIPQVVAAKHMGLSLLGDRFVADLEALKGRVRLLPVADDWFESAQRHPGAVTACWTGDAACGPAPLIALRDAILGRDWDVARTVGEEIAHAVRPLSPKRASRSSCATTSRSIAPRWRPQAGSNRDHAAHRTLRSRGIPRRGAGDRSALADPARQVRCDGGDGIGSALIGYEPGAVAWTG